MKKQNVPAPEAEALFREMDFSGSGFISVAKFDKYAALHTLDMVRQIFKNIDSSPDKKISKDEFKAYFLQTGLSEKQAHKLWDAIDENRNGSISFSEFKDWGLCHLEKNSLEEVASTLGLH